MRQPHVACQIASRKLTIHDQRCATTRTRNAQQTVRQDRWSIRLIRLVVVRVLIAQNVERAARRKLDDWREHKISQELVPTIAAPPDWRRSQYAAENESMTLIEQRIAALGPQVAIVLRQQQGLQIRRIIDRVRPGI